MFVWLDEGEGGSEVRVLEYFVGVACIGLGGTTLLFGIKMVLIGLQNIK